MKKIQTTRVLVLSLTLICALSFVTASAVEPVSFADNGGLKMLYDNRMYPQAVAVGDSIHIVWRGKDGFPYLATYRLDNRTVSPSKMLLEGLLDEVKTSKYERDHHYAPVIWADQNEFLHVLFGCHNSAGIHLISAQARSTDSWVRGPTFDESVSYPKVHRIHGDRTLIYFRHTGHLGHWQYRVSDDGGRIWNEPPRPIVDLNADPQDGEHAPYAGSYNTTVVSTDGRRLHVAFIWKVEDPVFNHRYKRVLGDHTQRYNLYYLWVDLPSGKAFNVQGREVELPVRKKTADEHCLVWDTDERVAAVGPSIALDAKDRPHFLLPVSDKTPLIGRFHFVCFEKGSWRKTPITETMHPFNASHLEVDHGVLRAFLIAGGCDTIVEKGMDEYGFGQRIEQWESRDRGESWVLHRDLTPSVSQKFQNIQFVSDGMKSVMKDVVLFYGWSDPAGQGTAFLWDARSQ